MCVALYIEMQSICPKEYSLMDNVQELDHYIILVLTTAVVNRNINFRHLMVLIVWLGIVPLVIEPTKEARGNVVHTLPPFKIIPSINWTYVIRRIMNTQAINIVRQQVIVRSRMFTFEAWQKDIIVHVHCHCNILCGGAWLLCLCMDYLIFTYFLQIICLDYLQMWWKDVPLWFFVFCTFYLQLSISDDIGIVSICINSIIIIIVIIIIN